MPPPQPLTQCDPPKLDWSRPGTPAAYDFGDIYFSTDGGIEETRTVFLEGCGLPKGWQNRDRFVIGELGFGSGLNFLTTWQLWQKTKTPNSRLHYVSIEKFPFEADELSKALSAWPELSNFTKQLISAWPGRVKGFHRLHFEDVTLTLIHDDIGAALGALDASIDAWFLDGFSPSKNPDMWSTEIMHKLAKLSSLGARLASFTVAGVVRTALQEAGFETEKKKGFGRKRHRLEARFSGLVKDKKLVISPTIIGAGIAGASLVKAFERRGIEPHVYHDPLHKAASHNAAAIVKPRFDLQDRPESRFFLASYLYAIQAYEDFSLTQGVTHIPKNPEELSRFEKLTKQAPLPPSHLRMKDKTLFLERSLTIIPKIILDNWLKIDRLKDQDWTKNKDIILAAGYGIKQILEDQNCALRYSRGQLSWAQAHADIDKPITYGGYVIPLGDEVLVGATHDRLTDRDPYELQANDDQQNFRGAKDFCGITLVKSKKPSRASVRVTTADTLPLISLLKDGRWLFTGLGSRGFVFAPLLAEALVSKICGDPMPVSKQLWARLSEREKSSRKTRPS